MSSPNHNVQGNQHSSLPPGRLIPGPPQLPPLYKGQKIQSGPYIITVTEEMVRERERQNEELYRAWLAEQRRSRMSDDEDYMGDFKHASVRRAFIRKVFCLLTFQLLITIIIIATFMFVPAAFEFMMVNWYLWMIALITFMVIYCAISCSQCARQQSPNNYICLFLLTVAMSYLAAFASVFYSTEAVLIAAAMTACTTFAIGVVATFSKFDLTMRTGLMTIFGLIVIISLIVMTILMLFTYIKVLHIIVALMVTLMLSMYLYFDIQTIMGGRRMELNPDEVVYATTQLYVDVILLYQYLLVLAGFVRD